MWVIKIVEKTVEKTVEKIVEKIVEKSGGKVTATAVFNNVVPITATEPDG